MDLEPVKADTDDIEIMEPLCAVFRRHLKSLGQKYTPERARSSTRSSRWTRSSKPIA
ncbi:MAG: hypothetical protein ACFHWZ_11185 [Phycisphaerales bacterium]